MEIKWDPEQQEIIDYEGDIIISGGRQSGKSFAASKRIAEIAKKYPKTVTLVMAASEKQESYIFEKVHDWLKDDKALSAKRQTLSKLTLKNGSKIIKHAPGRTGFLMKGLTCDFLVVDEAAYMGERVWDSIMPMIMLARAKGLGWRTFLGTTYGKQGFFHKCWESGKFKIIHMNTELCPRMQNEAGQAFLAEERERMTKLEYAQEYLGEFVEHNLAYFPTDLINNCMNFRFWDKKITPNRKFYLGLDIAGLGRDAEAFVCGELVGKKVKNFHNEILAKSRMPDTFRVIDKLDQKLFFNRIFIDPTGIGVGYLDVMKEKYGKRRVVGLDSASKSREKQKKILKEDMYSNCLRLMEQGRLSLIEDNEMRLALQSIQVLDGKIGGTKDHLVDALVRMAWCVKEKGLNLCVV